MTNFTFMRSGGLLAGSLFCVLLAGCGEPSESKLIANARSYLDRGQTSAAVIELRRALDKNAASGETRQLLGKALLESGDPAAAEVEFRKAVEAGADEDQTLPALARAMLLLGQPAKVILQFGEVKLRTPSAQADLLTWVAAAHAQLGHTEQAEAAVAAALQAQPQHAPAVMVQARLRASAGDVDGALALLDALLSREPGNEAAGIARGNLQWLGKGDAAAALQTYRKVLAAHPGSASAQAEIVTILFREGKFDEARQQFAALKKTAPNHPETLFFDAQFAYVDKQYKASREFTDALLKVTPEHLRALELAAAAEYHLGNDAMVQSFLARALKIAPGLILSRQILAQSYLRSNQPALALEALQPLVQGARPDAESLALSGTALMQAGDAKRADAAFRRAAQLAPENNKVRTQTAWALTGGARAEEGLQELRDLAAADKGPRADIVLVSALIARQDYRAALKAIDALQPKLPGQPLPDQLRGQVLVALGDGAGARRSFEAAQQKDAKYFPAVAALASMEVATGRPDEARRRVAPFIAAAPENGQAQLMLSALPGAKGEPAEDATAQLVEAVRASPADARLRLALIGAHLRRGDKASALAAAQAAAVTLPNDLAIMEALGQAQLLAGDTRQATATFRKLTGLQPTSAAAQMNLAEAFVASKDYDEAGRAMKRALELDPRLGEARRGLAMLALRDKRASDALAIAHEMQKLEPQSGLGYAVEGDIEAQRKNWQAAARAYQAALQRSDASEAAIKLHVALGASNQAAAADRLAADWELRHPKDAAFRFYLGDVATQAQHYDVAETHYRAVLASQPDNALAMNNIAWLLHKQARPGALEMARQANALLPNRAPILDTLATIQAASGKVPEAVKTQRLAVAASPQDPALKLALARYLIQAGERSEARGQLEALAQLGDRFSGQAEVKSLLNSP